MPYRLPCVDYGGDRRGAPVANCPTEYDKTVPNQGRVAPTALAPDAPHFVFALDAYISNTEVYIPCIGVLVASGK